MQDWLKHIPMEPAQFIYGAVAFCGGIARYLNGYVQGVNTFNGKVFFASVFVAGFSGYMFSLVGISLALPDTFRVIMAGTGGFFGEQTMKFVLEYTRSRTATIANTE